MTLIAIDTSAERCGVLVRAGGRDVTLEEDLGRGHDARLAPMTREALADAGVRPGELERIVVAVGPGGFTGVRVGVAFARGLAMALKIPAVGVLTLDALASGHDAPLLVAAHDAKREEVVWRGYRRAGAPLGEPARAPVADAAEAIDVLGAGAPVVLIGGGAPLLAGPGRVDSGTRRFELAALADLGAAMEPGAAPEPFYHRPADAKLPGGRAPSEEAVR